MASKQPLREALRRRDGDVCFVCSNPIDFSLPTSHPEGQSVEHVVPQLRGGSGEPSNLALSHRVCNETRGALMIAEIKRLRKWQRMLMAELLELGEEYLEHRCAGLSTTQIDIAIGQVCQEIRKVERKIRKMGVEP